MSIAALIRRMAELGAPAEAIALAVEAIEAEQSKDAERRAKRAAQKANERARKATVARQSRDMDATVGDVPASPEMVPSAPFPDPIPTNPLNPPTPQPVRRERRTFPEFFERFWKAYPRRDGANPKQPAAQKFDRIVAGGVDPEAIIAAAKRLSVAMASKDAKFVPQAVTWLNQARWQDEAGKPDTEPIAATFVVRGSPQWQAWTQHRGREPIVTHHGGKEGQFLPTEWPPQQENAA